VEREVWAGPSGSEARAALAIGPRRIPARLNVAVQPAGGDSLMDRLVTSVRSAWSGRALVEHPAVDRTGSARRTLLLPPGRYVVRAAPKGAGLFDRPPWHLPSETTIELGEGEARDIALSPVLGGHVRFALAASARRRPAGTALDVIGGEEMPLRFTSTAGEAGFLTTRTPLAPGRHMLAVDVPGFGRETVQVDVVAGRMIEVPLRLWPQR
jgi:hypothetical protein